MAGILVLGSLLLVGRFTGSYGCSCSDLGNFSLLVALLSSVQLRKSEPVGGIHARLVCVSTIRMFDRFLQSGQFEVLQKTSAGSGSGWVRWMGVTLDVIKRFNMKLWGIRL